MQLRRPIVVMFSTMTALAALATVWLLATPSRQATPSVAIKDSTAATPAAEAPTPVGVATTHRVRWDRSSEPDLAGYVVSWGGRPGVYTQSKQVAAEDTSTEIEVAPGTAEVYVAIRAVDRAGVLSGYSNEIAIGQAGKKANKSAGAKSTTKTKAAKKPPKTAEEKAEARRKKQERKRLKAESAKLPKPQSTP